MATVIGMYLAIILMEIVGMRLILFFYRGWYERQLSKYGRKLLDKLVADYCERLEPKDRKFKIEDSSSYIYNLFNSSEGYTYSGRQYKEVYEFLRNYP